MHSLVHKLPVSEHALLSTKIILTDFWEEYERKVNVTNTTKVYNAESEYTEIDPFTGQIRVIRR